MTTDNNILIFFQIKKVLMADCNRISATYDTSEMMEYLRLVGTLGEVTSYTDLFPILTLIALLSGEGLSSEGARFATDMRNKYFTVLVSRSTYGHSRGEGPGSILSIAVQR